MFGYGPGGWWDNITHVLWGIGSFFIGVIFFLIWLAVIVLFVRFLLIGTRAAKTYLRNNGEHDGVLPQRVTAPAAPATTTAAAPATTTTTRPAPRPRTPKTP
jgi:hypothetical protein